MYGKIICPKCHKEADADGSVSCMCDLDFCGGERCGADKLYGHYKCPYCKSEGTPPETLEYMRNHVEK